MPRRFEIDILSARGSISFLDLSMKMKRADYLVKPRGLPAVLRSLYSQFPTDVKVCEITWRAAAETHTAS